MIDDECSKGLIKLGNSLISLFGEAVRPLLTLLNGKADVKYIEMVSNEASKHLELAVKVEGRISISKPSDAEIKNVNIVGDALNLRKEKNRANILTKACEELKYENDVSDEPLNEDWFSRFLDYAGDISDEDVQLLWAKILSNEVRKPKSISLRTLDVLRNISWDEAKKISRIAPYIWTTDNRSLYLRDKEISKKYNVTFSDILSLDEVGLISSNPQLTYTLPFDVGQMKAFYNENFIIIMSNKKEKAIEINLSVYTLSKSGTELLRILHPCGNLEISQDYAKMIKTRNPEIDATLHQIDGPIVESGEITYDENDLLMVDKQ